MPLSGYIESWVNRLILHQTKPVKLPLLLLLAWVALLPNSLAQKMRFYGLDVDHGLSQNTIWDITQDSTGYLWFATADGVDRYDGYQFKHYDINRMHRSGQGGSTMFKLYLSSKNEVWVSHRGGLHRYNPHTDRFDHLAELPIIRTEPIVSILHINQKYAWIITSHEGLMQLDIQTGAKVRVDASLATFAHQAGINLKHFAVVRLRPGKLLLFNKEKQTYTTINSPANLDGAYPIKLSENQIVLISADTAAVFSLNNNSWEVRRLPNKPLLGEVNVSYSGTMYQNQLFLGDLYGLHKLSYPELSWQGQIKSFENFQQETFSYVQCLFVDREQNLWVGTNGSGLFCHSNRMNRFPWYAHSSLANNMLKSLLADKAGNVYAGVYSKGLFKYQLGSMAEPVFIPTPVGPRGLHFMAWYKEDELVFSDQKDVFWFDLKSGASKKIHAADVNISLIAQVPGKPATVDVLQDGKIIRYENGKVGVYTAQAGSESSAMVHITSDSLLVGGADGRIWVMVNGQKTKMFAQTNSIVKHLQHYRGRLYAATIAGLFEFDGQGKLLRRLHTESGLPNNFIYGSLPDTKGNIWFSHNAGLSCFTPKTGKLQHFGPADGLQSREFNTGAFATLPDGRLLFGGVRGFNIIDPNMALAALPLPGVELTALEINEKALPTDSLYRLNRQISLPYNFNSLGLYLSNMSYGAPGERQYAYRLRGYDNQWIENNNRNYIRYPNLPPGNYIFEARSRFGTEPWGPVNGKMRIKIQPPFWLRTWFLISAGLLLLSGIAISVRLWLRSREAVIRRNLEMQQRLENERKRISRDLHDNVGAQLTYLINNLDWLADQGGSEVEMGERLRTLSDSGRQAMLTLRQTIWAIGNEALEIEDFADRFKAYVLKMVAIHPSLHAEFDEDFTESSTLSPETALHLFRIGQEAVHNVLKHANATKLQVRFYNRPDCAFGLEITDNGQGFDAQAAPPAGHHGLLNMQARASECGAHCQLRSAPGKGCQITLELQSQWA